MRLLSPREARAKRDSEQDKLNIKIASLNTEITRLTSTLNKIRDSFKVEQNKIAEDLNLFIASINAQKRELLKDIECLIERKRLIEESVDEKAWTSRHESILKKEEEVNEKGKCLNEREISICRQEEELNHKSIEVREWALELERQNSTIQERKKELAGLENGLMEANEQFLSQKQEFITWLEEQKAGIAAEQENIRQDKEFIKSARAVNEEERKRLSNERIAIKDAYIALEQSKKHLNKNNGKRST